MLRKVLFLEKSWLPLVHIGWCWSQACWHGGNSATEQRPRLLDTILPGEEMYMALSCFCVPPLLIFNLLSLRYSTAKTTPVWQVFKNRVTPFTFSLVSFLVGRSRILKPLAESYSVWNCTRWLCEFPYPSQRKTNKTFLTNVFTPCCFGEVLALPEFLTAIFTTLNCMALNPHPPIPTPWTSS